MSDHDRFWQIAPGRPGLAHRWAPSKLFPSLARRWCNKGSAEQLRDLVTAPNARRCKACLRIERGRET